MKCIVLLFVLSFFKLTLFAQTNDEKLVGHYHDYFGNSIELNADSTFKYTWRFDLASSWNNGTWTIKKDTVYFKTILVYDTLRRKGNNGKFIDSLVLSDNEQPKIITNINVIDFISSGGQNRQHCPDKLFYDDEKLYNITKKGKLVKEKIRGDMSAEKEWNPWYFKQN